MLTMEMFNHLCRLANTLGEVQDDLPKQHPHQLTLVDAVTTIEQLIDALVPRLEPALAEGEDAAWQPTATADSTALSEFIAVPEWQELLVLQQSLRDEAEALTRLVRIYAAGRDLARLRVTIKHLTLMKEELRTLDLLDLPSSTSDGPARDMLQEP